MLQFLNLTLRPVHRWKGWRFSVSKSEKRYWTYCFKAIHFTVYSLSDRLVADLHRLRFDCPLQPEIVALIFSSLQSFYMQCTTVKCQTDISSSRVTRLRLKDVKPECQDRDSSCTMARVSQTDRAITKASSCEGTYHHQDEKLPASLIEQYLGLWPSIWPCLLYSGSACILQVMPC